MLLRRKPLNNLEFPKPLYIVKDPCGSNPQHAGIHSKVDVGKIMQQAENFRFTQDATLRVARDENITRYGQRSFTPKVNKEFRPPIIDPILDVFPLSRIPVTMTKGRINPRIPIQPRLEASTDVRKAIDEVKRIASVCPTYVVKLDPDRERPITKTLHRSYPQASARSGRIALRTVADPPQDVDLQRRNIELIEEAGVVSTLRYTPLSDDIELERRAPITAVHAGYEAPTTRIDFGSAEDIELERSSPLVSCESGFAPMSSLAEIDRDEYDLERRGDIVSLSSGIESDYHTSFAEVIRTDLDLGLNLPHTSSRLNAATQYRETNDGDFVARPRVERDNISHDAIPDYNVRLHSHVENPTLRPTTGVANPGNFSAGANIPQTHFSYAPRLRPKKR